MNFESLESRQMLSAAVTPFATPPAKNVVAQTVLTQKAAVSQPVVPAGGTVKTSAGNPVSNAGVVNRQVPAIGTAAERVSIDAGQEKAKEKADRAMDQATVNMVLGTVGGIVSVGSAAGGTLKTAACNPVSNAGVAHVQVSAIGRAVQGVGDVLNDNDGRERYSTEAEIAQKAERHKQEQKNKELAARLQEQQENSEFTTFRGLFGDDPGMNNCSTKGGATGVGPVGNVASAGLGNPPSNVATTFSYGIFSSKPISASPIGWI